MWKSINMNTTEQHDKRSGSSRYSQIKDSSEDEDDKVVTEMSVSENQDTVPSILLETITDLQLSYIHQADSIKIDPTLSSFEKSHQMFTSSDPPALHQSMVGMKLLNEELLGEEEVHSTSTAAEREAAFKSMPLKTLKPHEYQKKIFKHVTDQWDKSNQKLRDSRQQGARVDKEDRYGNIVYLDTGTGKTYIVVMLLKYLFGQKSDLDLVPLGLKEMDAKRQERDFLSVKLFQEKTRLRALKPDEDYQVLSEQAVKNVFPNQTKKVVFIVPTQNLVEQQALTIDRYTNLKVGNYSGGSKSRKLYSEYESWRTEFALQDVFVAMAKKFYDFLMHGFLKIEEIDLLVFDECHHTDQEHMYNLIMKDFFFFNFEPTNVECRRPRILGLTASPIKQKIEKEVLAEDIQSMLNILANNLYSRFVTINEEDIRKLEQNITLKIKPFSSNFACNRNMVQKIDEELLKELLKLVPLSPQSYTLDCVRDFPVEDKSCDVLLASLYDSAYTEFCEQNQQTDPEVIKYLQNRKQLIQIDSAFTKKQLDISKFKAEEDRVLVILCIIMIKNINNLQIELGAIAIKVFFVDLMNDLLINGLTRSLSSEKKDKCVSIIRKFCESIDNMYGLRDQNLCQRLEALKDRKESFVSQKVFKLVQILNKSIGQNQNLKTIVFVKDRCVATYLYKILTGKQEVRSAEQRLAIVDTAKVRVGVVMGLKSRNQVNRAYKSTNTENVEIFNDVLSKLPSCNSSKMNSNQLRESIERFRTGDLNVLIATNVVEEGLDVSSCNQIICLNELFNVKQYIQYKGRARAVDSKFIYLVAEELSQKTHEEVKQHKRVIQFMKKVANQGGVHPSDDIVECKQPDKGTYLETETGAKISMRDAKQLVESFCLTCAEKHLKLNKLQTSAVSFANQSLSFDQPAFPNSVDQGHESKLFLENKPNYIVQESNKFGIKYFYCRLYLPIVCRDILKKTKINPTAAFARKKDAENHVALEGLKLLRQKKLINDNLFPCNIVNKELIGALSKENQSDPHMKKKRTVTQDQIDAFRQQCSSFNESSKSNKSKISDSRKINLLNQMHFELDFDHLFIQTLMPPESEDNPGFNYPYKDCTDFIGFLFDRKFSSNFEFCVYQEYKQRAKNQEHLKNLFRNGQIKTKAATVAREQFEDTLKVGIDPRHAFALSKDLFSPLASPTREVKLELIAKLHFFHVWVFYYLYSADHKFLKAIFKEKFPFVNLLFIKELHFIKSNQTFAENLKKVYGENAAYSHQQHQRKKCSECHGCQQSQEEARKQIKVLPFSVPVTQVNGELKLNWKLIDKTVFYIQQQLLEVCIPATRDAVVSKYDLEEVLKQDRTKMISRLWDQKLNGYRFVILVSEANADFWKVPIDYNKKPEEREAWKRRMSNQPENSLQTYIESSQSDFQVFTVDKSSTSMTFQQIDETRWNQPKYMPQEFYFIKQQGTYVQRRFNKYLIRARKERHFIDFGRRRKDKEDGDVEIRQQQRLTEEDLVDGDTMNLFGKGHLLHDSKISTEFQLFDEAISLSPLSYNQFQVLQQTCYHMLNVNEFLLIEKFINKEFSKMHWLADPETLDRSVRASDVYFHYDGPLLDVTSDKIGDSDYIALQASKRLLSKIDLVREALTAPSANREFDYERLEFYGDSIIGFLVILELFLANPSFSEGDMDFHRITRVANMRFHKVNKEQGFEKFMITEPHHVFSGFLPVGFDEKNNKKHLNYQQKITHKTFNELNNKLLELKKLELRIQLMRRKTGKGNKKLIQDDLKDLFMVAEFYPLIKMTLRKSEILEKLIEKEKVPKRIRDLFEKQDLESVKAAVRILTKSETFSVLDILYWAVKLCFDETKAKKNKQRRSRDDRNDKSLKGYKVPHIKQLADVVESITGATCIACGLNLTQNFLRRLGILDLHQGILQTKYEAMQVRQVEREPTLKFFYDNWNLKEVENILGYNFKCKSWLVEALTHKSKIDQAVTQHLNMTPEDYERLEFLGDSILSFMIAQHFFETTQDTGRRFMPKELHKMKTSVVNNALLGLIVIENKLYKHIIYNDKAIGFVDQFKRCVQQVEEFVEMHCSTKEYATYLEENFGNQNDEYSRSQYEINPIACLGSKLEG